MRNLGKFNVNGLVCTITPTQDGLFELTAEGVRYVDRSPRWLSESALESGATVCKWTFDLRLAWVWI